MNKIKLLLIDDEPDITEIVSEIIMESYDEIEVIIANNARSAASLMPGCDIIISDINMPEKDILDQAIEKYSPLKPTARITGHYDQIENQEFIIKKPFNFKTVKSMVDKLLALFAESNNVKVKDPLIEFNDSLLALERYNILDTPPSKEFDHLTFLASSICDTEFSFIGFMDGKRQWFKSKHNFEEHEILKEDSFCYKTTNENKTVIVEDMLLDNAYKSMRYVVEEPFIRFYASVPLISDDNYLIGRICVTSRQPKKMTELQIQSLEALGSQCMQVLENRRRYLEEKKSMAWKKALLNNSSYAIISANTSNQIVTFNSAAERMFGYSQKEVLSETFSPESLHIKSEIRQVRNEISAKYNISLNEEEVFTHMPKKGECFEKEWTYRRKDGSTFPGLLSLNSIRDEEDKVIGYIGIIKDLTEQREKDLLINHQQNTILESSKMSSLGEMASSIAHEINNPLAILSGKCQILIKQFENGTLNPEATLPTLHKMVSTVERASKIIRGLKNFSRNSDGEPFSPQKIKSVLSESLDLCEEKFKNNGIRISIDADKDYEYLGQGIKMSQVFINLLNNSFDALTYVSDKWINIRILSRENKISIIYTDSGPEIPMSIKDKMMSPFFTTKEIGKGTGIGLSISKGICEQHGGDFIFDKNAKNTTFIIELPLNKAQVTS